MAVCSTRGVLKDDQDEYDDEKCKRYSATAVHLFQPPAQPLSGAESTHCPWSDAYLPMA